MTKYISLLFFVTLFFTLSAQTKPKPPVSPLRIPLFLAGNFGELRANHFHSGIDFKTQGKIGIPVYSFDEGYVARIMYSARGNGRALYINHPNGMTSVYLHLDHFNDKLDALFDEIQYAQENYEANHYFKENEVKVERGELIAYSGNSGGSAGPHLHFELRDTKSEEIFDPISYFRNVVKDHIAPQAREVVIYPMHYGGVINGQMQKCFLPVINRTIKSEPTAWGKIALGLKAFDQKDGVSNVYGVKYVKLYVNDELIFSSDIDRFAFKNTRSINSFIDYAEWIKRRSVIMKSFVDPGNKIEMFSDIKEGGIITINEEKPYRIKYVLTDEYDNSSELKFTINGKNQPLPDVSIDCRNKFFWDKATHFVAPKLTMDIAAGMLYDDLCFDYRIAPSVLYYSDVHTLHNPEVPLHDYCTMDIKVDRDTLSDKSKYYVARVVGRSTAYQKSEYRKGWVRGWFREFGSFAVLADTKAPTIIPLKAAIAGNRLDFRVSDSGSGIGTFRGTIDGKFALFEMIPSRGVLTCKLSPIHVSRKQVHQLKLVIRDNCNNETVYEDQFFW